MHIHPHPRPYRGINIRFDVGERGLKWAWLFKMKNFPPWNLLLLTLAVCSITLLNWRLFRGTKAGWRGCRDYASFRCQPGSLPGFCTRYFHIKLNAQKNPKWLMTYFSPPASQTSLWSVTVIKKRVVECVYFSLSKGIATLMNNKGCKVQYVLYRGGVIVYIV